MGSDLWEHTVPTTSYARRALIMMHRCLTQKNVRDTLDLHSCWLGCAWHVMAAMQSDAQIAAW